jgi:putative FmdB family regulatory protein
LIYTYDCEKCGRFEYEQRIVDDPLSSCPTCGSKVTKIITGGAGIVFKAKGFYCTDNKKSNIHTGGN